MGYGSWDRTSYTSYAYSTGRSVTSSGNLSTTYTAQDLFKAKGLDLSLSPYNIMRECCDSEDHPKTIPVVLALDVTGSMGTSVAEVAKRLNEVMTKLYSEVPDVEFCIMGIGDLVYDTAPIQISQFEADIRIAEWLDKIWFERGGGGNGFESYTAAWYMGSRHMKLDCWKRGQKGLIITLGDEPLNPYLPSEQLNRATGDPLQGNIETRDLFIECSDKFDIYHIAVDGELTNCFRRYETTIHETFGKYLDQKHLRIAKISEIIDTIVNIIKGCANTQNSMITAGMPVISW